MPLFAHAGSVGTKGADVQHSADQPDGPIMLYVLKDAHGAVTAHLKVARTEVSIRRDEKAGTRSIGRRRGKPADMASERFVTVCASIGRGRRRAEIRPECRTLIYGGPAVMPEPGRAASGLTAPRRAATLVTISGRGG